MVDDHSRLAYSEILPDEKGPTCAAFMIRAAGYFATGESRHIEQVITDNHLSYRRSLAFANAVTELGAKQLFIRRTAPWQNGESRTPQPNPFRPNGLTGGPSPQTPTELQPLRPGLTLQHSTTSQRTGRPTAHQPDRRTWCPGTSSRRIGYF